MISIKYRNITIAIFYLKNINFIYNRLFCCNHTCYCVGMVSVESASHYQSRSLMYIQGMILHNSMELAETVQIAHGGRWTTDTGRSQFKNSPLSTLSSGELNTCENGSHMYLSSSCLFRVDLKPMIQNGIYSNRDSIHLLTSLR